MMAQAGKRWPLASVDSVNIARNFKTQEERPSMMAHRLNRENNTTMLDKFAEPIQILEAAE